MVRYLQGQARSSDWRRESIAEGEEPTQDGGC